MKAHLLYADRDIDLDEPAPPNEQALVTDLELEHLLAAMARGDEFLLKVARVTVLHPLDDPAHIIHRQAVLRDCLAEPSIMRALHGIAEDALRRERKDFWGFGGINSRPESAVYRSVQVLEMFMQELARLRALATEHGARFHSAGMSTLLAALVGELDDTYVAEVRDHLAQLRQKYGTRMSARLDRGNEGTDYLLHKNPKPTWRERLLRRPADSYVVQIPDRDMAGAQALGDIRDRGLRLVAAALSQATQHIHDFFTMVRAEVAFYVGCLNLSETLAARARPICFPEPVAAGRPTLTASGLYDPSLSLLTDQAVVGNDVHGDDVSVIFITGANRGGKSTLLRSIGIAQLMMQCGMFVPADTYRGDIRQHVFTHFKREEDATMTRGKLDEELNRMSEVVDQITPGSLLLCNESFASTNEREGSQIARDIVTALRDSGIKIVYVTHLFELAHGFHTERRDDTLFLRAPRAHDGTRPFRLIDGEPLPTSYGPDIYKKVFGESPKARQPI